jgi:hypothetical protein
MGAMSIVAPRLAPEPGRMSKSAVSPLATRGAVGVSKPPLRPKMVSLRTTCTRARSALDESNRSIDDELSKRPLALDPKGYFIITIDPENQTIQADHYKNTINEKGLACDEETGEVIGCKGSTHVLLPSRKFSGRTAKELSVEILESQGLGVPCEYCSHLEHANYLGRELQRAETCLRDGTTYVQD